MCLASEKLLDDIARWFATSTYLSQRVIQSPELLDALVLNQSDLTVLELDQELTHLSDYKFLREAWIISRFLESLDLRTFSHALTQTADEIALAVLTQLKNEFPSTQLQIIAGGKWGGREFGINSDLDLLFFSSGETSSEIKVARRWMNRITELRKGGALYKVDLRLTPQYSSGVLLQAEQTFMDYVATKSSAWERQAFLRLRAIETSISLQAAIKSRTLSTSELQELKKIQSQLFLTAKSELDVKLNPGGLLHTELVAQTLALLNQRDSETTSSTLDLIEKYLPAEVSKTYLILKSIEQLHRIFSESSAPLSEQSTSLKAIIAKSQTWSLGTSTIEFSSNIKAMLSDNAARLQCLDPRETAE